VVSLCAEFDRNRRIADIDQVAACWHARCRQRFAVVTNVGVRDAVDAAASGATIPHGDLIVSGV